MLLNDPAAVHTFITIMATSYMEPMSNGLDFISLTSHRKTEDGPSFCCLLVWEVYWLLSKCLSVRSFICRLLLIQCACLLRVFVSGRCVVCVSTWMYLNLLLFTPIVQLCLGELLWSNWMSRGRAGRGGGGGGREGDLWQWMWCPLALLSVIRQPLCLCFLIHSWIQKWMWWTSEVNAAGGDGPEPVLISSQIEQSLYPPPQLRGELAFNIPGHAFWQGTPPQTTNGLQRLLRDTLLFLMRKLGLNIPLGLKRQICSVCRKVCFFSFTPPPPTRGSLE